MNNVYEVIFRLQDNASNALKSIETGIKNVSTELDKAKSSWGGFVSASQQAATGLGAIGAGLAALGGAMVKAAADFEQSQIAFTTLLGDGQKAKKFLEDLQTFANSTPFEFKGLQDSARQLLAFGFQAQNILPIMTSIGDAVSALGGGQFEIGRVTLALGQMQAKGKVTAEEMMQLAETGLPVWDILAKKMGKSIGDTMKAASDGAISASQGVSAILQGLEERFHGSMNAQSQTLNGLFSTLKDSASTTMRIVGQEIVKQLDLSNVVNRGINTLNRLQDWAKNGGVAEAFAWIKDNALLVAGAIGGVLAPAISSAVAATTAFIIRIAPLAAIGTAVAIALKNAGISADDLKRIFALVAQAVAGLIAVFQGLGIGLVGIANYIGDFFRSIIGNFSSYFKAASDAVSKFQQGDFIGAYNSYKQALGLFDKATQAGTESLISAFVKAEPLISSGLGKITSSLNGQAAPQFQKFADDVTGNINQVITSFNNLSNLGNLPGSGAGGTGNAATGWTEEAVRRLLPAARALVEQVNALQKAGQFLEADSALEKFFNKGKDAAKEAFKVATDEYNRFIKLTQSLRGTDPRRFLPNLADIANAAQLYRNSQANNLFGTDPRRFLPFGLDSQALKDATRLFEVIENFRGTDPYRFLQDSGLFPIDQIGLEYRISQGFYGTNPDRFLPFNGDKSAAADAGRDYAALEAFSGTNPDRFLAFGGLDPKLVAKEWVQAFVNNPDFQLFGTNPDRFLGTSKEDIAQAAKDYQAVENFQGTAPSRFLPDTTGMAEAAKIYARRNDPFNQIADGFQAVFGAVVPPLQIFGDILQRINPIAAIMEGFLSALAPVIESVKEPMKIVGEILATLIMPVFQILHPIIKLVAMGLGGLALIVAKVWNALAWLVDKVTFGFVKLYIDESKITDALARLGDSALSTSASLNSLNQSSAGVPSGFKVALAAYNAMTPASIGGLSLYATPLPSIQMTVVTNDPQVIAAKLDDFYARRNYIRTGTPLGVPSRFTR